MKGTKTVNNRMEAIDLLENVLNELERKCVTIRKQITMGRSALLGAAMGTWRSENVSRILLPLQEHKVKSVFTGSTPNFRRLVQVITK